jgi:ATP-dependent Clp protease ATP-binding subunit ClpA
MKYNFTDGVRLSLAHAAREARRRRHDYVAADHILLGILRTYRTRGTELLPGLAVDVDALRDRVLSLSREGKMDVRDEVSLPYTSHAKMALEFAIEESRLFGHEFVDIGHVLLGLLHLENAGVTDVLTSMGITLETARRAVRNMHEAWSREDEDSPDLLQRPEPADGARVLVSAEVPVWVDAEDAAELVAQVVHALSRLHIGLGGDGLVVDDVEIHASERV